MKYLLLLFSLLFRLAGAGAQNVGINADNSDPHPSAGLDVKFENKGFLPPRMSLQQRDAIASPADGLMVFCTNSGTNGALCIFYSGIGWITFSLCNATAPVAGTHIPEANQITWNWNAVTGAAGYKWNTINDYNSATEMGTETTKTETGLPCNTAYTRFVWSYFSCGTSAPSTLVQSTEALPAPIAGINVPAITEIKWNWNPVTGATGYKWNTTDDYNSATDMGTETSKTETGLTGGNTYTRYVWSYNACGVSVKTTLSQSTLYIGLSYQGGIVFYIDDTEQHGLIAAPSDHWDDAQWGCSGTTIVGTSTAIGSGQANTTAIVNGCNTARIAARICNDLVLNGYSDWFLPSNDELNQLYLQKSVVGGFFNYYYWSSSEYNAGNAWGQDFSNSIQNPASKTNAYYVRAVRAF
jgi:hypothetical protein